ncbi:hypothetical protein PR048_003126 [Dryococelus australis]|uniref:Uncharacterized protein n=1 Tax=Dryococelus australis TaxID=614101 RepID=A0ABQ9IM91_9NEOP|nr:hypothetical protein PR048_003126 [Dryococelus australis]
MYTTTTRPRSASHLDMVLVDTGVSSAARTYLWMTDSNACGDLPHPRPAAHQPTAPREVGYCGRNGKESAMAFVEVSSHHSPGVISEKHVKQESGWPDRDSNPGPLECDSSESFTSHLACSPPTNAKLVQFPAGSSDFRMWESRRTMSLVDGFSRGSPVSHTRSFQRCCILVSITLIGYQDFAVKSRPKLFTHIAPTYLAHGICTSKLKAHETLFWVYGVEALSHHYDSCFPTGSTRQRDFSAYSLLGATVAERLACSPPTKAIRVQSTAGSIAGFRVWESCRTMPLFGGFSRGSPVSPALSSRRCSIRASIPLIGSQDLDERAAQISSLIPLLTTLPPPLIIPCWPSIYLNSDTALSCAVPHRALRTARAVESVASRLERLVVVLILFPSHPCSTCPFRYPMHPDSTACSRPPSHKLARILPLVRGVILAVGTANRLFGAPTRSCTDNHRCTAAFLASLHCLRFAHASYYTRNGTRGQVKRHDGNTASLACRSDETLELRLTLVGGLSRGSPVSPTLSFRHRSILTSITLIGSQDLNVKSCPNLFTHSFAICVKKRQFGLCRVVLSVPPPHTPPRDLDTTHGWFVLWTLCRGGGGAASRPGQEMRNMICDWRAGAMPSQHRPLPITSALKAPAPAITRPARLWANSRLARKHLANPITARCGATAEAED